MQELLCNEAWQPLSQPQNTTMRQQGNEAMSPGRSPVPVPTPWSASSGAACFKSPTCRASKSSAVGCFEILIYGTSKYSAVVCCTMRKPPTCRTPKSSAATCCDLHCHASNLHLQNLKNPCCSMFQPQGPGNRASYMAHRCNINRTTGYVSPFTGSTPLICGSSIHFTPDRMQSTQDYVAVVAMVQRC